MKNYFGVMSTTPSNKKLKNGYTIYDWVVRQKCFPAFWGRTILGKDPISIEEIGFLKEKNCKIMLIIRDLNEAKVSGNNGTEDALRAVKVAKSLGIQPNDKIAFWVEIKPEWSINHNWMISFAKELSFNGYIPGFIGNTDSSQNFNFDRQCSHYVQATKAFNMFGAKYCATEPKLSEVPAEWMPFCPSALKVNDMHLWSCGKTFFDEFEIDDVYAREKNVLDYMWEGGN